MAFPTTSVIYTGAGGNEDPWSEGGTITCPIRSTGPPNHLQRTSSKIAMPAAGAGTGEAYKNDATYGETENFLTIDTLPATNNEYVGGYVRIQTPGTAGVDGYLFEWVWKSAADDTLDVYRMINQGYSASLGQRTLATVAGDQVGCRVTGTGATVTIQLFWNGSQLGADISDTDAARIVASGNIGWEMVTPASVTRLTNLGGGEVVSGTTYAKTGNAIA